MTADVRPWNILMGISVLALASLLAFDRLMPPLSNRQDIETRLAKEKEVRDKTYDLRTELAAMQGRIEARVWKGDADTVGAQTLELSTRIAKAKGMSLTAFRPQKVQEEGELTRLSFVLTLEGPFPGLQGVVRELETPDHRLSVHLVQVSSADEASDLVNATVGVTAFLEKPKAKPEIKDKKL